MNRFCGVSKRWWAFLTLTVFIISNHLNSPLLYASENISGTQTPETVLLPKDIALIQLPSSLGKIEDSFQGTSPQTILIVQDAHAIPEAQKSIQRIIEHFEKSYGVNQIGLEGVSSDLDPQIFKSFPDKKLLQKVFGEYFDRGELTGGSAAAVFSDFPAVFHGIENWSLYEQGIRLYLATMKDEGKLNEKLSSWKDDLDKRKKETYPEKLLQVDSELENFSDNKTDLLNILKFLASVKPPDSKTEIAILLEESGKEGKDNSALDMEVRRLSLQVEKYLKTSNQKVIPEILNRESADPRLKHSGMTKVSLVDQLRKFNEKRQEFQTARLSPQAFALFLKELAGKYNLELNVSDELLGGIKNQKTMRDIEGTKFFKDFERYAQSVKDSLIQNENEKKLDRETELFNFIGQVVKLELSREDWNGIKAGKIQIQNNPFISKEDLNAHLAFYENAEKRDQAFFEHTLEFTKKETEKGFILVAGGFHAQGLTKRLKEKNISYLLMMPSIGKIPAEINYRNQMKGEVSWKNYFKVENGKINIYKAFVRATRDKLLADSNDSSLRGAERRSNLSSQIASTSLETSSRNDSLSDAKRYTLKNWHDQIIRDLAAKEQIAKAGNYTQFIDELASPQSANPNILSDEFKQGLEKINRFIASLRKLQSENQLNEQNVLRMLKPSAIESIVGAVLGANDEISEDLAMGRAAAVTPELNSARAVSAPKGETVKVPPARSEVREGTYIFRANAQLGFNSLEPSLASLKIDVPVGMMGVYSLEEYGNLEEVNTDCVDSCTAVALQIKRPSRKFENQDENLIGVGHIMIQGGGINLDDKNNPSALSLKDQVGKIFDVLTTQFGFKKNEIKKLVISHRLGSYKRGGKAPFFNDAKTVSMEELEQEFQNDPRFEGTEIRFHRRGTGGKDVLAVDIKATRDGVSLFDTMSKNGKTYNQEPVFISWTDAQLQQDKVRSEVRNRSEEEWDETFKAPDSVFRNREIKDYDDHLGLDFVKYRQDLIRNLKINPAKKIRLVDIGAAHGSVLRKLVEEMTRQGVNPNQIEALGTNLTEGFSEEDFKAIHAKLINKVDIQSKNFPDMVGSVDFAMAVEVPVPQNPSEMDLLMNHLSKILLPGGTAFYQIDKESSNYYAKRLNDYKRQGINVSLGRGKKREFYVLSVTKSSRSEARNVNDQNKQQLSQELQTLVGKAKKNLINRREFDIESRLLLKRAEGFGISTVTNRKGDTIKLGQFLWQLGQTIPEKPSSANVASGLQSQEAIKVLSEANVALYIDGSLHAATFYSPSSEFSDEAIKKERGKPSRFFHSSRGLQAITAQNLIASDIHRLENENPYNLIESFLREKLEEMSKQGKSSLLVYYPSTVYYEKTKRKVWREVKKGLFSKEKLEVEEEVSVSKRRPMLTTEAIENYQGTPENVVALYLMMPETTDDVGRRGNFFENILLVPESVFNKIKDTLEKDPALIYKVIEERAPHLFNNFYKKRFTQKLALDQDKSIQPQIMDSKGNPTNTIQILNMNLDRRSEVRSTGDEEEEFTSEQERAEELERQLLRDLGILNLGMVGERLHKLMGSQPAGFGTGELLTLSKISLLNAAGLLRSFSRGEANRLSDRKITKNLRDAFVMVLSIEFDGSNWSRATESLHTKLFLLHLIAVLSEALKKAKDHQKFTADLEEFRRDLGEVDLAPINAWPVGMNRVSHKFLQLIVVLRKGILKEIAVAKRNLPLEKIENKAERKKAKDEFQKVRSRYLEKQNQILNLVEQAGSRVYVLSGSGIFLKEVGVSDEKVKEIEQSVRLLKRMNRRLIKVYGDIKEQFTLLSQDYNQAMGFSENQGVGEVPFDAALWKFFPDGKIDSDLKSDLENFSRVRKSLLSELKISSQAPRDLISFLRTASRKNFTANNKNAVQNLEYFVHFLRLYETPLLIFFSERTMLLPHFKEFFKIATRRSEARQSQEGDSEKFESVMQELSQKFEREDALNAVQTLINQKKDPDASVADFDLLVHFGNFISDSGIDIDGPNGLNVLTKIQEHLNSLDPSQFKAPLVTNQEFQTVRATLNRSPEIYKAHLQAGDWVMLGQNAFIKIVSMNQAEAKINVVIRIGDSEEAKSIDFASGKPVILGRTAQDRVKESGILEEFQYFTINESGVSRAHAKLTYDKGELTLEDLNSTNGTHTTTAKTSLKMKLQSLPPSTKQPFPVSQTVTTPAEQKMNEFEKRLRTAEAETRQGSKGGQYRQLTRDWPEVKAALEQEKFDPSIIQGLEVRLGKIKTDVEANRSEARMNYKESLSRSGVFDEKALKRLVSHIFQQQRKHPEAFNENKLGVILNDVNIQIKELKAMNVNELWNELNAQLSDEKYTRKGMDGFGYLTEWGNDKLVYINSLLKGNESSERAKERYGGKNLGIWLSDDNKNWVITLLSERIVNQAIGYPVWKRSSVRSEARDLTKESENKYVYTHEGDDSAYGNIVPPLIIEALKKAGRNDGRDIEKVTIIDPNNSREVTVHRFEPDVDLAPIRKGTKVSIYLKPRRSEARSAAQDTAGNNIAQLSKREVNFEDLLESILSKKELTSFEAGVIVGYVNGQGIEALQNALEETLKERLAKHGILSTTDEALIAREKIQSLIKTLDRYKDLKPEDMKLAFGLILNEDSLGNNLLNVLNSSQSGQVGTVAFIGKINLKIREAFQKLSIVLRPLRSLAKQSALGDQASMPVGTLDEFKGIVDEMFVIFNVQGLDNVANPVVKDGVEVLQIVTLIHAAAILKSAPDLLKKDPEAFKKELLIRLRFSTDSRMFIPSEHGFTIAADLAEAYLTEKSKEAIEHAA